MVLGAGGEQEECCCNEKFAVGNQEAAEVVEGSYFMRSGFWLTNSDHCFFTDLCFLFEGEGCRLRLASGLESWRWQV